MGYKGTILILIGFFVLWIKLTQYILTVLVTTSSEILLLCIYKMMCYCLWQIFMAFWILAPVSSTSSLWGISPEHVRARMLGVWVWSNGHGPTKEPASPGPAQQEDLVSCWLPSHHSPDSLARCSSLLWCWPLLAFFYTLAQGTQLKAAADSCPAIILISLFHCSRRFLLHLRILPTALTFSGSSLRIYSQRVINMRNKGENRFKFSLVLRIRIWWYCSWLSAEGRDSMGWLPLVLTCDRSFCQFSLLMYLLLECTFCIDMFYFFPRKGTLKLDTLYHFLSSTFPRPPLNR